jgi:hypothetical protein
LVVVGYKNQSEKPGFRFANLRGNKQFPCHLNEDVGKQGLNVKSTLNPLLKWEVRVALVANNRKVINQ